MEIKATREYAVLIMYFITATILLLDCVNNFPGIIVLRKIKYVFLIFLIVDFITSKYHKVSKSSSFILLWLILHTIIFGVFFVNPSVGALTRVHCREMMIYLGLLAFLTNAIERYNCKKEFIEFTCAAFTIFMLWVGITHISSFVNPVYYVFVFIRNARIRSDFGTAQYNYMGYYCFIGIVFYYALWYEYKRIGKVSNRLKYFLLVMVIWTALILFSTGSRSSVLSVMVFMALCIYYEFLERRLGRNRYWFILVVIIVSVAFLYLYGDQIWANANRESNITVNIPVFEQIGAFWKGMGYIESSGFYNDAYGYDTWPVDIYYLYIYFTTGIIGTIIISIPLLYLFVKLTKSKNDFAKRFAFPVYIAILFDGIWQVNIFTYRYITSLFIGVLLLTSISMQKSVRGT